MLDVNVFPNPSTGIFNISFSSLVKQDFEIKVVNSIGELVKGYSVNSYIGDYFNIIDLKRYSNGVYFLEIYSDKQRVFNKKIILSK